MLEGFVLEIQVMLETKPNNCHQVKTANTSEIRFSVQVFLVDVKFFFLKAFIKLHFIVLSVL